METSNPDPSLFGKNDNPVVETSVAVVTMKAARSSSRRTERKVQPTHNVRHKEMPEVI